MRVEIREEFRTSSRPSDAGGNPPPVTIYTWLERFNKQKPHSFKKSTAPVDVENWISYIEKIFDVMGSAGTEEEQAKNFQWGLRRSTLNHLMCMSYTDVAQVANAARNYEILHERDDDDTERPDKRQKSGDRHQPTSQQSSHRNHGHNNDRHRSDRRNGGDNHRSNNNYSGRIPVMGVTKETGVSSPTDLPFLVLSSPGVPLRATHIQFALLVDADTQESVVELLVLASSVVKLAIYRKITRRTPLRVHLVMLIRSQVHRVVFSPSLKVMLLIPQMVNTRTNAKLATTVQNALQTLLPQIRAEIREEFRTGSGPSSSMEILHHSLFILSLNALISKSPVHLRRQ
nr:zinc finger, CCHC-type, retrotransposon Gag domain protein [Tanacetum cinerariifolium]